MKAVDRSGRDWLEDIERNAAKIVAYTAGLRFEDFIANEPVSDLVIVKLQNMGEAARYLLDGHPRYASRIQLPLGAMRVMRNRLSHGYFSLRYDIIWDTVQGDIPGVLATVRDLIAAEDGQ